RFVFFRPCFKQSEVTKLAGEFFRTIPGNLESTARPWSLRPKRRYDQKPLVFEAAARPVHVRLTVLRFGQEMKDRTIMPEIVTIRFQFNLCNVAFQPADFGGSVFEALFRLE